MRLLAAPKAIRSCQRSSVVVGGLTLGISKTEVTPPASAARLSLSMSALWVIPGSRKCT